MTIAPVSWRMRSSRIVWPAAAHVSAHLDLRELEVGPVAVVTASRNAVTCGLSTRFAITCPAVVYGRTTRSAPASTQLLLGVSVRGARDDRQVGRADRAERTM